MKMTLLTRSNLECNQQSWPNGKDGRVKAKDYFESCPGHGKRLILQKRKVLAKRCRKESRIDKLGVTPSHH